MMHFSLLLLISLILPSIFTSVDEFNTPQPKRGCDGNGSVRRGWCQCPQDCQFTMLGLTARPLCFSSYPQPLITCTFPFHGTCLSLNNELLPYCYSYPACAFPDDTEGVGSDPKSGTVTIVDPRELRFWTATFERPAGSQIIADTYCEEGYTARCVHLVPFL